MSYCNHPFDTQTNEALNQAIANVAPKSICSELFDRLGVTMTDTLLNFLEKKLRKKGRKQNYQWTLEVKIDRGRQQKKARDI
jgi:hypothetical protein